MKHTVFFLSLDVFFFCKTVSRLIFLNCMFESGINKLITAWSGHYFTEPFYLLCEMVAAVYGFLYHRKTRIGKLFLFYILFDFLLAMVTSALFVFKGMARDDRIVYLNITNAAISVIELTVYYAFFSLILRSKGNLRLLKTLNYSFYIFFLIATINYTIWNQFKESNYGFFITVVEFVLLLAPSLLYFKNLFSTDPIFNLTKRPSFWIVTGILFYSFVSIPFLSIVDYLFVNEYLHYKALSSFMIWVPFGINFLFLSKAFSCKTILTT
jgi:hypothetical protein